MLLTNRRVMRDSLISSGPGSSKLFFSGVSLRWADALKWVVEFAVACCVESPVVVAALVFVDGLIRAVSLGRF